VAIDKELAHPTTLTMHYWRLKLKPQILPTLLSSEEDKFDRMDAHAASLSVNGDSDIFRVRISYDALDAQMRGT
jgi:hypothetical protein